MTLPVRCAIRDIHVSFDAPVGAITALLGPNGAGKTTVLESVARTFDGRVGLVFQDHLLFPHMTALDNVAFGPRSQGASRTASRATAQEWLARVGLAAFADAKPRTLSGGQAQLVALARALASQPEVLLLDEPLAALDAGTRVTVRRDLRRFLADFAGPTLLVTHDPVDAYALADSVVVIEAGAVVQTGTIAEIAARPASRYVADLVGTNLVRGRAEGDTTLRVDGGATLTMAEAASGALLATISPGAITLQRDEPKSSARNAWETTITHVESLGARVRVQLGAPLALVAEITPSAAADLAIADGTRIWASVKATEITTYPA